MELSSGPVLQTVQDSRLTDWEVIGCGGFGQIYKARHQKWCCNVAVKLLHYDDGNSGCLLREIQMMRQGSSPYVIQVLGMFKGRPPSTGPSVQLGLVMEFMERGSLAYLQDILCGPAPWPLVFRLAHQVALGINFLHNMTPALLHLDLKPSNVLLDSYLNAKLTDFGLARFYHSVTRISKKDSEDEGGTISYMPPEAFDISYSPSRASDIYSYGILLWSIVTGRPPYANAMTSIVRLRIPQGDRPSLEEISSRAAGIAGLAGLKSLMERCWDTKPNQRPTSYVCTTETEELFKMHKHSVVDAVHQVLKKMDKKEQSLIEMVQRDHVTQTSAVGAKVEAVNVYDVPTGRSPVQEMAAGWPSSPRVKARFEETTEGRRSPRPVNVTDVDLSRSSTEPKVKASSVHPIESTQRSADQGGPARTPQQAFRPGHVESEHLARRSPAGSKMADMYSQNAAKQGAALYERQFSSPDALSCRHPIPGLGVKIHLSNVTGLQYGNNNAMHIYAADPLERKRHPTAPSSVNLPPPNSQSRRNKMGGVG